MIAARLVVITLAFLVVSAFLVRTPKAVQVKKPSNEPPQKKIQKASDLSSKIVLSELKARGLDPAKTTTSPKLRDAFIQYDFQANGSGLNPNNKEFMDAAKNLSADLEETSLQSHVTIRTQTPGARVYYRLIGKETVTPFNQLTNDTADDITIGLYYIWAERAGKPTSSKEIIFRVIKKQATVDLVESIQ
jgi:hypothetical protein